MKTKAVPKLKAFKCWKYETERKFLFYTSCLEAFLVEIAKILKSLELQGSYYKTVVIVRVR